MFHLGVREKVFVQVGGDHLNEPITLYLKEEPGNVLLSEKKIVTCTQESPIQLVELMVWKLLIHTKIILDGIEILLTQVSYLHVYR